MFISRRKRGEGLKIGQAVVEVLEITAREVKLGISAPKSVVIQEITLKRDESALTPERRAA